MSLKTRFHLTVIGRGGGRLIDDDDIEAGQYLWVLSKRLSNNSLDTVSCRCFAAVLFRDSQTQPRGLIIASSAQHCKQFIAAACRFFEHAPERGSRKQSIRLLEPVCSAARQA